MQHANSNILALQRLTAHQTTKAWATGSITLELGPTSLSLEAWSWKSLD